VAGDDPEVRALVADLNALPERPPWIGSCPADRFGDYAVVARYEDGHAETVWVNPDGCGDVSNGTRRTYFAPPSVTGAVLRIDLRD